MTQDQPPEDNVQWETPERRRPRRLDEETEDVGFPIVWVLIGGLAALLTIGLVALGLVRHLHQAKRNGLDYTKRGAAHDGNTYHVRHRHGIRRPGADQRSDRHRAHGQADRRFAAHRDADATHADANAGTGGADRDQGGRICAHRQHGCDRP